MNSNIMDEIPRHEIRTIRIGNHEFRTYNLTFNDGSSRKITLIECGTRPQTLG